MHPNLHPRGKGLYEMGTNPCAIQRTRIRINISHGYFRIFDWKSMILGISRKCQKKHKIQTVLRAQNKIHLWSSKNVFSNQMHLFNRRFRSCNVRRKRIQTHIMRIRRYRVQFLTFCLTVHAEIGMVEHSVEIHEFSKWCVFKSRYDRNVKDFDLNPRALDSSRPVLSNAHGFGSISRIGFLLVSK